MDIDEKYKRIVDFSGNGLNITYTVEFEKSKPDFGYGNFNNIKSCNLYFGKKRIKDFYSDEKGLELLGGLDFYPINDAIMHYVINSETNMYLLKATNYIATGYFAKISYGYLIVEQNGKCFCYVLQSYKVPNDFYIGKIGDKIVYLDISSEPGENNEFIYTIVPKLFDLNKHTLNQIYKNGNIAKIIVATPYENDYSKYRILLNNWY